MSPQRGFAYHIDAEWNIGIVEKNGRNLREKLKIFGPALAFILAGFVIAYQFVAPAPPRTITMATGSPQGTYFSTGQAYQEILAREGVTLNLINTAGSIENIKLLETASEKVDIDFREFILSPFHDRKCPPPSLNIPLTIAKKTGSCAEGPHQGAYQNLPRIDFFYFAVDNHR